MQFHFEVVIATSDDRSWRMNHSSDKLIPKKMTVKWSVAHSLILVYLQFSCPHGCFASYLFLKVNLSITTPCLS